MYASAMRGYSWKDLEVSGDMQSEMQSVQIGWGIYFGISRLRDNLTA